MQLRGKLAFVLFWDMMPEPWASVSARELIDQSKPNNTFSAITAKAQKHRLTDAPDDLQPVIGGG
ncbi:MAG: hypothetical protein JRH18_03240 [Deltaproteobacteria bacterium]|nr:hypothetical protein [Deltaproteobacteria bacterium]MBW1960546.1 hypothetical protein [Deltaproteobacteria bacterium]MBW1994659.1 hypothetical protein [Deltaproteobacteria bacterium]MBW2150663.1 hypothetical protein [Deltaproteobacteria bacterium]